FVHAQERCLEAQLDTLLALVQRRDATAFQPLLRGKAGLTAPPDAMRALSPRGRGGRLPAGHGGGVPPRWEKRGGPRSVTVSICVHLWPILRSDQCCSISILRSRSRTKERTGPASTPGTFGALRRQAAACRAWMWRSPMSRRT